MKVVLFLAALRLIFDLNTIIQLEFWLRFIPMLFLFLFLMSFVVNLGTFMFDHEVKIPDLKRGMMPVQGVMKKGKKYMKVPFSGTVFSKKEDYLIDYSPVGLTSEQIKKLNELYKNGRLGFDSLTVQETMPFAALLFIGVLITILCQGNLVDWFKIWIH
jgi:hypothetical protein